MSQAKQDWLEHRYCHAGHTAPQARANLADLVGELGLDWFAYALFRPPVGRDTNLASTVLTNYPAQWVDRYLNGQYQLFDPVIELAASSNRPFYWGQGRFLRTLRKAQRQVFDEARAFGIASGLAIPLHGPDGAVGVFCVAADNEERVRKAVRHEHERLFSAAYDAHDFALRSGTGADRRDTQEFFLTLRERECLLWTAEGKTAGEVGSILGISVFTVNRHVSVAARKLGSSNKYHAALQALRAGLI